MSYSLNYKQGEHLFQVFNATVCASCGSSFPPLLHIRHHKPIRAGGYIDAFKNLDLVHSSPLWYFNDASGIPVYGNVYYVSPCIKDIARKFSRNKPTSYFLPIFFLVKTATDFSLWFMCIASLYILSYRRDWSLMIK